MELRALHFFRASIFFSILLLILGYIVTLNPVHAMDAKLGEAMYQLGGVDRLFIFLSFIGSRKFFYPALAIFSLLLVYKKYFRSLLMVWLNLLGVSSLNHFLKKIYMRDRPILDHIVEASNYSFPSGHTMNSFAFYGMITFLLIVMIKSKKWKVSLCISAAIIVLLIGISRIYLGVHFPLDVIAGMIAGAAWLSFVIAVWLKLIPHKKTL